MSTIKTDTLSNQAGSKTVPADTVVAGSAKAWVNFNGTGVVAIRDSFNVSSITDNGVGNYTVNFTVAMPDANYSIGWGGNVSNNGGGSFIVGTMAAGSFSIGASVYPNVLVDSSFSMLTIHSN